MVSIPSAIGNHGEVKLEFRTSGFRISAVGFRVLGFRQLASWWVRYTGAKTDWISNLCSLSCRGICEGLCTTITYPNDVAYILEYGAP